MSYQSLGDGTAALIWRQHNMEAFAIDESSRRPPVSRVLVGDARILTFDVAIAVCRTGLPSAIGSLPGQVLPDSRLPSISANRLLHLAEAASSFLDQTARQQLGLDRLIAAAISNVGIPLRVQLPEASMELPPQDGPQSSLLWGILRTLHPLLADLNSGIPGWSFSTCEPVSDADPSNLPYIVFCSAGPTAPTPVVRREIRLRPFDSADESAVTPHDDVARALVTAYRELGAAEFTDRLALVVRSHKTIDARINAIRANFPTEDDKASKVDRTFRGHVFISYVREDLKRVDHLQEALEEAGIPVWRDTVDLWPGEDWRKEIRQAITNNALVFLACFSSNSLARAESYQNEELTLAIEQMRRRPPGVPWLIPVRFDECIVPDIDIGAGRSLTSIQRADLFDPPSKELIEKLIAAVLRIFRKSSRGTNLAGAVREVLPASAPSSHASAIASASSARDIPSQRSAPSPEPSTARPTHDAVGVQAMSVRRPRAAGDGAVPDLAAVTAGQPLDPRVPYRIDGYEILRRLGEGSMGMVYLARDEDGNLVAVKVIRPEYARESAFLRRVQADADSASRVQAPDVAGVITAATGKEPPYLVTEFIDGPTLQEQVQQHGPLSERSAISLARTVAAALAAIHQAGIVHGNLAPSNVILSDSGPKIIDFGITQAIGAYSRPAEINQQIGKPAYMSPEQINRGELTVASDIFAWAGLMVFTVAGHQPFASPDSPVTAVWRAISESDPNLAGVPSPLQSVLRTALEKDPARRPTAHELLDRLDAARLPLSPSHREGRFQLKGFRLRRNIRMIVGYAAVLVVGALAWILVPSGPGSAYSVINYSGGKYGFQAPASIAVDSAHVWVVNSDSNSLTELNAGSGEWVQTITGRRYLFSRSEGIADYGGRVWVVNYYSHSVTELNASNGALIRTLSRPRHPYGRAIADDGVHIWVTNSDSNSVTELNASNGALIRTINGPTYGFDYPWGIAADRTHVWVCNGHDHSVIELSASNGDLMRIISDRNHGLSDPKEVADDGTHVWIVNYFGNSVTELNASTGTWIRTIKGRNYGLNGTYGIAYGDAHIWVANTRGNSVTELNASDGALIQTFKGRKYDFRGPWGIATDGTNIWITNYDGNSVTELNSH